MNRIILSAIIATGFHIALMWSMPSLSKNNKILPPPIKPVSVTISYRQPEIKKNTKTTPEKKVKQNKPDRVIPKQKKAIKKIPKSVKAVKTIQTHKKEQKSGYLCLW